MQKFSFTTVTAGTIEIDDVNISSLSGERIFRLNDFDGNSVKTRVEAVKCIDMPGQKTISAYSDVKTVVAKIAFAPVYMQGNQLRCTGSAGMYALRRAVLRHFPIGESGILVYTNDSGSYTITARIDEVPVVTVKDGYLCECTLMFTCDYPYWCKTITSAEKSVSAGGSVTFSPPEYGDIASPVGGIIRCTQSLSGEGNNGIQFKLQNSDNALKNICFCSLMKSGSTIEFDFLYDNKWEVRYNRVPYSGCVYFLEYCEPCVSVPHASNFVFNLYSSSGSVNVKLLYRNLYVAV